MCLKDKTVFLSPNKLSSYFIHVIQNYAFPLKMINLLDMENYAVKNIIEDPNKL